MAITWRTATITDTTTYTALATAYDPKSYVALAVVAGGDITVEVSWSPDGGSTKYPMGGLEELAAGTHVKIEWPAANFYVKGVTGTGTTTVRYAIARFD